MYPSSFGGSWFKSIARIELPAPDEGAGWSINECVP